VFSLLNTSFILLKEGIEMNKNEIDRISDNAKELISDIENIKSMKEEKDSLNMELGLSKILRDVLLNKINE